MNYVSLDESVRERAKYLLLDYLGVASIIEGKPGFLRAYSPVSDPENPLSWNEIIEKFNQLSAAVFNEEHCRNIVDRVRKFEDESNVARLMEILACRG